MLSDKEIDISEENVNNDDQLDLDELDEASGEKHLEAGSPDLSLDDLDSVAGGLVVRGEVED